MIYVFHGADSFSMKETVSDLREAVGPIDVRDANTTAVSGQELSLPQLTQFCHTIPFLADRRLVIVEGLLESVGGDGPGARTTRRAPAGRRGRTSDPGPWRGLRDALADLPPTTDLVFLDGPLRRNNPLLRDLAPIAQVREFPVLRGVHLQRWILQRGASRGATLTPGAALLLAELVGGDLWSLSNEVEKLSLYCQGRAVQERDVRELVGQTREASIFAAVDAALLSRTGAALQLVHRLLDDGAPVSYILFMLARQLRLVLVAQELLRDKVPHEEAGKRLGIASEYPLRKTMDMARQLPSARLRRAHSLLLDTDVAIKTGALEERVALELLVARLCVDPSPARVGAGPASHSRTGL